MKHIHRFLSYLGKNSDELNADIEKIHVPDDAERASAELLFLITLQYSGRDHHRARGS